MLSGCGIFCEEASRHVDDDFAEYEEDTFDEVEGFDSAGRFEYMFVSNDEPGEAKEEPRAAPAADVPRRSSRFCCRRPRPALREHSRLRARSRFARRGTFPPA